MRDILHHRNTEAAATKAKNHIASEAIKRPIATAPLGPRNRHPGMAKTAMTPINPKRISSMEMMLTTDMTLLFKSINWS